MHEPAPASGVIVDEVHGSENKVPFFLSICLVAPETDLLPLCMRFSQPFVMTFCFFLQQQNDDVSVAPEKVADMSVSGTGCSDGVVLTEPQSSIGAEVSDAEQGKTTGDIILEKDHVESAVQTGGSAAASPEKSPAAEPSVDVDAVQAQPKVFLVSDSPAAPAAAGVLPDDAATSTGDDDEDTESDSYGEEVDHSSAATGLGKDP